MDTRNNLVVSIGQLTATNDALVIAVANYRAKGLDGLIAVTEAVCAHIRAVANLIDGLLGEAGDNDLAREDTPRH